MRRILVNDGKLDDLIVQRDSVRIQISLLRDRAMVDSEELAALRNKASALEDAIRERQRSL